MFRKVLITTVAASAALAALVPAAEARPRVYKSTWEAHAKIGGTGIGGHALLRQRDGALILALRVTGLAAASRHAVHVHAGTCAAQGAVVVPVPDLIANDRGVARIWIALPTDPGVDVAEAGYYVNIHEGFGAATGGGIACGDIVEHAGRGLARVSGTTVRGVVRLRQTGTELTGSVGLRNAAANSAHTVNVQAGSCATPGSELVSFPSITADATGRVRKAPLAGTSAVDVVLKANSVTIKSASGTVEACGNIVGGFPRPTWPGIGRWGW